MKILVLIFGVIFISAEAKAQVIPKWNLDSLRHHLSNGTSVKVINFWATFCKPCVQELPHFLEICKSNERKGVQLLLVSLDLPSEYPRRLKTFVKSRGITAPVVWLNESNADYFCPAVDSSWGGSIPATLIMNVKTGFRKFFEKPLTPSELETVINEAMK